MYFAPKIYDNESNFSLYVYVYVCVCVSVCNVYVCMYIYVWMYFASYIYENESNFSLYVWLVLDLNLEIIDDWFENRIVDDWFCGVQGEWTWLESTLTMKATRCCQWRYGKTQSWRFGSTMRESTKRFSESRMLMISTVCVRILPILTRYNISNGDQIFLALVCVCG